MRREIKEIFSSNITWIALSYIVLNLLYWIPLANETLTFFTSVEVFDFGTNFINVIYHPIYVLLEINQFFPILLFVLNTYVGVFLYKRIKERVHVVIKYLVLFFAGLTIVIIPIYIFLMLFFLPALGGLAN